MVKNGICNEYCECTGSYIQTKGNVSPDNLKSPNLLNEMTDIRLFMSLMRNFAQYHGFVMLRDVTQQMMQVF